MRSKKSTYNNNIISVVSKLLDILKVSVSDTSIHERLEEHPEYPSLLAISDCLNEWNISNQAYQIPKADYDSHDLQFPFIAHFNSLGGSYILVHDIKDNNVVYSDEANHKALLDETDFLEKWSGIILFATANEKSGEANYHTKRMHEIINAIKTPILLLLILSAIGLALKVPFLNYSYYLTLLVNFFGLSLSTLLLIHSLDANNPLVQNLCSLGQKNNCNAILKSKAANLTSWLTWSEVGFFYFAGSFAVIIYLQLALPVIAWLNLLAIPYTIYSIGYQYKNKNWCVLCCGIQILLWFGLLINVFQAQSFNVSILQFSITNIVTFAICFLLPALAWSILKPYFAKAEQYRLLKLQLQQFKYNGELFNQLLVSQPKFAIPDDLTPIILGNPSADTTITMVSNPFCTPCAKAHETLHQWLSHRDDIKLKIIFTTANHDGDEKTKVAKHLTALSMMHDTKLISTALDNWYLQHHKKYEDWAAKYPIVFDETSDIITKKQKDWCKMAEITSTPTILINGYKLPNQYQLEDIKYLLY